MPRHEHHIWLNEGFATYLTVLTDEFLTPHDDWKDRIRWYINFVTETRLLGSSYLLLYYEQVFLYLHGEDYDICYSQAFSSLYL